TGGSYRLGRLGAPRPATSAPPAPHYPSFAPQHRGPAALWLLACLAGAVIVAAGALAGWWFLPFLTGLAGGLAAPYGRWRLRGSLPAVLLGAPAGGGAGPGGGLGRCPVVAGARRAPGGRGGPGDRGPGRPARVFGRRGRGHAAGSGDPGGRRPVARPGAGARVRAAIAHQPWSPAIRRG